MNVLKYPAEFSTDFPEDLKDKLPEEILKLLPKDFLNDSLEKFPMEFFEKFTNKQLLQEFLNRNGENPGGAPEVISEKKLQETS